MTQGCFFCGGSHELGHACDGKQGHVEAQEDLATWTPTRTTREAMALLERTRRMAIARGRVVAQELIGRDGSTHTRAVFAAMRERDELPAGVLHHHWLGAVFRVAPFRWTGDWFVYADPGRNIHERRIKTWTTR